MEKDVVRKMERLCSRYQEAAIIIDRARPIYAVGGRRVRQAQGKVVDAVMGLQSKRKTTAASLVRLSYVRGKRSHSPQARLNEYDVAQIRMIQQVLDQRLRLVETEALVHFRRHIRKVNLANTMERFGYPQDSIESVIAPGPFYPLEQHARAILTRTLEDAQQQGSVAKDYPSGYDGEPHVR